MLSSKWWNNKASVIKLVYLYSTIKMMKGPINLRYRKCCLKTCKWAYHIHGETSKLAKMPNSKENSYADKWNKKSPTLCEDLSCIMGLTWTPYWDPILSDLNLIPLEEINQYNRSKDLWRTPLIGVFHCTNSLFLTPKKLFIHEQRYRNLLTYFSTG